MVSFRSFRSLVVNICLFSLTLSLVLLPLHVDRVALAQSPSDYTIAQVSPYSPIDQNEQAIVEAYLAAANRIATHPTTMVTRLVTTGSYALLSWVYGEMGGQAVMVHTESGWQVLRGTGGVTGVPLMIQFGVPADVAQELQTLYEQKYR
jgi:hypothetical protein